jgi:flagellar hook-basal body complex protein FliE
MIDSILSGAQAQPLAKEALSASKALANTSDAKTLKLPEGTSAGQMMNEFGDLLKGHLQQVNQLANDAGKLSQSYALGESVPLHQVMVASEKASVAMELTLQIRNKLVQAYQDMMHMPL